MTNKSPEQELWQAVVYQAFSDALNEGDYSPPIPIKGETNKKYRVRADAHKTRANKINVERDTARAWLLSWSEDMRRVCEFAGYLPIVILEKAQHLENEGWPRLNDIGNQDDGTGYVCE